MSAIDKLRQQIPLVVAEYFQRVRDAEAARESETRAVTRVQAAARGFLVRRRILHLTEHAVVVQRCWRGYLGRLRAKHARELHYKRLRQVYFDTMAIHIQRRWRGFWSRKHVHNFYARKAYLEAVRAKSEAVRQELNEEAERAMAAQRQAVEEAARRLFDEKIARLHHLTSTVSQPGIFNSPYSIATGTLPVIAGVPVEEHLRVSSKAQVKQRLPPLGSGSGKIGPRVQQQQAQRRGNGTIGAQQTQRNGSLGAAGDSPARSGARSGATDPYPDTVVVNGERIPRRLTLRQSVPYDTLHVAEVLEEKVHRGEMLTKHPLPFYSALSLPPLPTLEIQSNRNVEHYGDPYDPTIGVRNEHFTPVQQRISASPFLKYMRKQPFFDKAQAEAY